MDVHWLLILLMVPAGLGLKLVPLFALLILSLGRYEERIFENSVQFVWRDKDSGTGTMALDLAVETENMTANEKSRHTDV